MWVGVGELIPGKQSVPCHNGRAGSDGTWDGLGRISLVSKTFQWGRRCGLARVCGVFIHTYIYVYIIYIFTHG